jgi:DHA1 family tetracycline resistance protein-like MFS transporter
MGLAVIPAVALGAVVTPALTGLMANATPDDAQGELQGLLASATAVAMIVTPLFASQLFGHFTDPAATVQFPGAPFLAAAIVMTLSLVPFAIGLRRVPR